MLLRLSYIDVIDVNGSDRLDESYSEADPDAADRRRGAVERARDLQATNKLLDRGYIGDSEGGGVSPLIAVTAIGTFSMDSARLLAVTTTS